jgi:ketosteroid isomerase-like protein
LRIQTSEMMATPDAEMVLRVLEWSLRDIAVEVVRDGRRITVRGLGPSQRTMNRNDIAVVEVVCENHHTVIRADITYQASAMLGGASQDDLVRSKLDRVLDRVKMELGTQSVRVEALPWFSDPVREPELGLEPEYIIEPEYALEQEHAVGAKRDFELEAGVESEHFVETEPARAAEPVVEPEVDVEPEAVESEHFVEVEPTHAVEPVVEPEIVREPEVVTERGASDAVPVVIEAIPVEVVPEKPIRITGSSSRVEIPMFQTFHSEDVRTPKRWGLLATVACMLAAVGLFLAWPYLAGLVHERLHPSSSVSEESVAGETSEASKLAADKVPMHVPDANAAAVRNASIHEESDPRVWLESWADAMRGEDAGEQASFYADPVEHYALKSNVSNADVWLDKKNAIQSRPTGWTVKLENVVVEPRPDASMRVRLTKHYTSQSDGGRVSEQLIHSQLKLRKIDGQWKITSEQNLRP